MEKFKMRAMIISSLGLMLLMVGVTYSFFNYTKTGSENTLGTGRIYFNTTEGTTLSITNAFPMTSTEASTATLDSVTVGIVGDTNYNDGEEYQITLVDVNNTINGKEIPINYIATYTAASGGTVGSSSDTYWTARNSKDASIYTLESSGEVSEGKQVLVGYIDNGSTGISGTLTIKAYIDADRIAISDTYNGPSATPSDNKGTTSSWVNGRTVFTTTEWNSLTSNPVSFKIKAESNEGIWAEKTGSIPTCQDCKFIRVVNTQMYPTWNTGNNTPTVLTTGYSENYLDIVNSSGKNYFLGVKLNNNNEITNAYVCGIVNGKAACLEGTSDGSKYADHVTLLQGSNLYNNTCTTNNSSSYEYTLCGPWNGTTVSANIDGSGYVSFGVGTNSNGNCNVYSDGEISCYESN